MRRVVRRDTRALDGPWRRRVEVLKKRLGLGRRVRVLASAAVSRPLVTGCWRPAVLLPLSLFSGLPVAHLESLILHELVHVVRRDLWVQRLQLVLETLFFYHPAVWWISRIAHAEREFCCDAAVVALTGDRIGYARALTSVESLRPHTARQALAATGGPLMSRIRSIVRMDRAYRHTPLSTAAWSLGALGLLVALVATTSAIGDSTHGFTPTWMPDAVGRWSAELRRAAERHGVDPTLLSIVTLVESRGNPDAISPWGAVGLMQIMPATGDRIAAERGIAEFDLRDPETNLDFGAWYLARQLREFGEGDLSEKTVARAAAAYNGGPQLLRSHLEEGRPLSSETERYSELVAQLWRDRDRAVSQTAARLVVEKPL